MSSILAEKSPCSPLSSPFGRDAEYFRIFSIINHATMSILTHSLLPTLVRSQVELRMWDTKDQRERD